jgi:hypothetical protein
MPKAWLITKSYRKPLQKVECKDIGKPCQKLASLSNSIGSMTTIDSHKSRN